MSVGVPHVAARGPVRVNVIAPRSRNATEVAFNYSYKLQIEKKFKYSNIGAYTKQNMSKLVERSLPLAHLLLAGGRRRKRQKQCVGEIFIPPTSQEYEVTRSSVLAGDQRTAKVLCASCCTGGQTTRCHRVKIMKFTFKYAT